jgi:valyl-tRNA synthetase
VYWEGATDHGGSSTEIVMHRHLQARSKAPRDVTESNRRSLLSSLTQESVSKIHQQFKDLRLDLDFDSLRSMADPDVQAHYDHYVENLFRRGHLYWAEKIDDWCYDRAQSVPTYDCIPETRAVQSYTLRYSVGASTFEIDHTELAFLLDEVGVAVPADSDLARLDGQVAINPLGRPVPVYAGNVTRAMSLIPAHDDASLRFCQSRNNIETPCSIDESGYIRAGILQGQEFRTAVPEVLALIHAQRTLVLTREQTVDVQICRGTGYRIYKRLVPGLFLRTSKLLPAAIDVISAERVTLYPARYKKWLLNWFRSLLTLAEDADWRITREHLCGNPIPASVIAASLQSSTNQVPGYRLDMTISCGLWAYIANNHYFRDAGAGQAQTPDTALCATGVDLLFFWIGRVIVLGVALELETPLSEVIVHPLIADKRGIKMSKSAGNAVDLDEIVRQCGAPALRLYLLSRMDETQEFIRVDCEEIRKLADELGADRSHPRSIDTGPPIPVEEVTRDLETIEQALAARDVGRAAQTVLSWVASRHRWIRPLPKDIALRVREISEVFMTEPLTELRPQAAPSFRAPQSAGALRMPGS